MFGPIGTGFVREKATEICLLGLGSGAGIRAEYINYQTPLSGQPGFDNCKGRKRVSLPNTVLIKSFITVSVLMKVFSREQTTKASVLLGQFVQFVCTRPSSRAGPWRDSLLIYRIRTEA